NAEWKKQWGDAWDTIAGAEKAYSDFYLRYGAPGIGRRTLGDLFGKARTLVRLADELPKPDPDRLREYSSARMPSVELQLYSPAPIYDDLEIDRVASGLQLMGEFLGGDDPIVVQALGGLPPRARAEQLVLGTKLKDVAERKRLAAGGK